MFLNMPLTFLDPQFHYFLSGECPLFLFLPLKILLGFFKEQIPTHIQSWFPLFHQHLLLKLFKGI